jgi:hypothetical protein
MMNDYDETMMPAVGSKWRTQPSGNRVEVITRARFQQDDEVRYVLLDTVELGDGRRAPAGREGLMQLGAWHSLYEPDESDRTAETTCAERVAQDAADRTYGLDLANAAILGSDQ